MAAISVLVTHGIGPGSTPSLFLLKGLTLDPVVIGPLPSVALLASSEPTVRLQGSYVPTINLLASKG